MVKTAIKWLIIANVIIGFNAPGWTEEGDPGRTAYESSCAPCHGADGKGSGLLSADLRAISPPPDLTVLSKRNSGDFPAKTVIEIIEATFIAANSARKMPIMGFDRRGTAAIVDYLKRIQEK